MRIKLTKLLYAHVQIQISCDCLPARATLKNGLYSTMCGHMLFSACWMRLANKNASHSHSKAVSEDMIFYCHLGLCSHQH
jgi:hypothetical protein